VDATTRSEDDNEEDHSCGGLQLILEQQLSSAASTSLMYDGPVNSRVLLDSAAALAVAVNGAINPAVYAVRNPNVARVLRLGRQQRYGGYVTDDAGSSSATNAAATVTTARRGGALGDRRLDAEQQDNPPVISATVTQDTTRAQCDATNSAAVTYVVPVDSSRQREDVDNRTWAVDFWAWRRNSSSYGTTPSVVYNVTARRKSSQSSTRTSSTLTSVVL